MCGTPYAWHEGCVVRDESVSIYYLFQKNGDADRVDGAEPPKKKSKLITGGDGAGKDDLFDAHDFDLADFDFDPVLSSIGGSSSAPPPASASAPIKVSGVGDLSSRSVTASGPNKRSLNLSDYKKKRGLI
jgi:hypothetical protein